MSVMVKRKQQKLKYYRYCFRKARELMRSELRKCEILAGRARLMKQTMNAKQRNRYERKKYLKALRYGARYEVITTPAIRELIVNKKKIRRQQIWRLCGTEEYRLHMGSKRRKSK